ncbi:MAG: LPS export ABC transporter permease LptG [Alphaproteobacteria bacterium]|nr:LPS export ABC transporter permease LptG [Alphaproteobacteria bacterium]
MSAVPWTLYTYFGRLFLLSVAAVQGGIMALVFLVDLIEMLRQHADRAGMTWSLLVGMSLLKMPNLAEKVLPFSVFFAAMWAFFRLTRTSELVVTRAAGVSVWQFLAPALLIALGGGWLIVCLFNPISAAMTARYAALEAKYIRGEASLLYMANSGLWLRQADKNATDGSGLIVHALRVNDRRLDLDDVIIWRLTREGGFLERVDAASASLREPNWEIRDATITPNQGPSEHRDVYRIPTTITATQIRESFASPDTLSFWDLPRFIQMAESAGFSALRHRMHWHALLALPFLLGAMVLIAANFSIKFMRHAGRIRLAATGVLTAFLIFFVSNFAAALGQSGVLPVMLAAWFPTGLAMALGANMLLHSEDG